MRCRVGILLAPTVALGLAAGAAWASFPGANGTIVYGWTSANKYAGSPTSIRAVDPSSGAVRTLRDCPLNTDVHPLMYPNCDVSAPRFSADGTRIAFPSVQIGYPPDGPLELRTLLSVITPTGRTGAEHPTAHRYRRLAWSPSGDRLLVERGAWSAGDGPSAIFLAAADGTALSQLTPERTQEPDWSSTGRIVFTRARDSCRPSCHDLYVTHVGATPRRLTYRGGSNASWSPHGTQLAFVRGGRRQNIYLVRRDGRGLRQLTHRGGWNPAWSPDGRWIAFVRAGDLYVVRTNGRGLRRLVDEPPFDWSLGLGPQVTSIDWQPLPR